MLLEALDTVDPSTWTLLWKIVALTALPTVAMAVGGVLVQFYQPGPRLTSVLQHFAAGVVFGALALEMLPLLEPVTDWGILAVIGGYIGGVIVMLLVGRTIPHFLGEMDDIIEDHEKHHDDPESKSLVPAEREGLIPWGLVTPVIIDGLIDGLLVGIAFSAGNNAGIIMAIAIAIEMCFLGMTVSIAMNLLNVSRTKALLLCIGIPLGIPIAGACGAVMLSHLDPSGYAFVAMISFGSAALMYLVADELLVEAHVDPDTDKWYITLQFFSGFLVTLLLQKLEVYF